MISTYGIFGALKMFLFLIKTKIFFPKARLIRFPIDVRNKKNIVLGENWTKGVADRIKSLKKNNTNYNF